MASKSRESKLENTVKALCLFLAFSTLGCWWWGYVVGEENGKKLGTVSMVQICLSLMRSGRSE